SIKPNRFGLDTNHRLEMALHSIEKNHSDASFITITGDLANSGKEGSYIELKKLLDDFKIPVHLILGNHDNKEVFNQFFDLCKKEKYVQYVEKYEKKVFIFLDTRIDNEEFGTLCQERLNWLKKQLDKSKNKNVYLFMHHFPLKSQLPWMEKNAPYKNKKEFWDLISKYSNVKHIFTGHLHRIINANYKGVGVSTTRSTNFQVAYTPNSDEDYLTTEEKPMYSVVTLEDDLTFIHNHEFLSEEMIYIPNEY
ncbi:MAG: metallophosphoesterase, partial [Campylobacterota bacterium]|nr:metallophosphoesterase [Campylobacterota bacterium]